MTPHPKNHHYQVEVEWTGNQGQGTASYGAYARAHDIRATGKPTIPGSSDPAFRGDKTRYNPEELLVASLSTCHMLWYLHLCADSGIPVIEYRDRPIGTLIETSEGGGRFSEVILKPVVILNANSDMALARQLHEQAHHLCFIANSVNFPVRCEASVLIA